MPPSSSRGSGRGTRTGNISRHSRTRNRVTRLLSVLEVVVGAVEGEEVI